MAHSNNWYKADLRDYRFVIFEQFKLQQVLGQEPFEDWGKEEVVATLAEVYRFSTEVLGPLNAVGDREGVKLVNGQAVTPAGFKDAWDKLYASGFLLLSVSKSHGGAAGPRTLAAIANEMTTGANTAFDMYPGLTAGALELIEACGTPEQHARYMPPMLEGRWSGTMCLTEPQAGSDVGAAATTAVKNADGSYSITGTKMFISGGDQDLTENIIHLVLARTPGAPPGTKGLSLFLVPKFKLNADGSTSAERNDVTVAALEHKMGINGSSTALLNFGDEGKCTGELVGGVELQGMRQMFQMMNFARIGVGLQSLGVASAAYLAALSYARERKQGSSIENFKDASAPRVPIIQHPNVRNMLIDMKARVEGARALLVKLTTHIDFAAALQGKDDAKVEYHKGQVELLTPLVKAFGSDQAFRVCESAIQVHGGVGYTKDFPVEQYARDAKIFSIYEGTNGIQALDLVARKLGQRGGQNARDFLGDVQQFVTTHQAHPVLGAYVQQLGLAQEAVAGAAMQFMAWFGAGEMLKVPLHANRFLRMMSEVAVGWLLLEQAVIALEAQSKLSRTDQDWAFYEGKRFAAVYYVQQVVSEVVGAAKVLASGDTSAWDIPAESFATV